MPWIAADFKGKPVLAQVDARGEPVSTKGRVPMRYSDRPGARIYHASAANLKIDHESAVVDIDDASGSGAKAGGRGSGFGKAGTRSEGQKAMAAEAARTMIEGLDASTIVAYTDGGCRGNPGPAGSGVRVQLPDGSAIEACRSLGRATNNIAELTAIGLALDILDGEGVAPDAPVVVLTDSGYSQGVLVRGWKAKANRELILDLRERIAARPGFRIAWVAGHVGIAGNERADALANAGVDGVTDQRRISAGEL